MTNSLMHTLPKESPTELFKQVEQAISVGDLLQAKQRIDALSSEVDSPDPKRLAIVRAKLAAAEGDKKKSIDHWQEAATLGFDAERARLNIANMHLSLGEPGIARKYTSPESANRSIRHSSLMVLARCYMRERRWSDAATQLELLSQFGIDSMPIVQYQNCQKMLFQCYLNSDRLSDVEMICERLEKIDSDQVFNLRGRLNFSLFNYVDAEEYFRHSIEKYDDYESKVWLLRTMYLSKSSKLTTEVERLITLEPDNKTRHGKYWELAGDITNATACYESLVIERTDISTYQQLVDFHFNSRDYGRAYEAIARAKAQGLESEELLQLEQKIKHAFQLTDFKPDQTFNGSAASRFMVNERMVEGVINKILDRDSHTSITNDLLRTPVRSVAIVLRALSSGGGERQAVNLANGLIEHPQIDSVSLLCTDLTRREENSFYLSQVDSRVTVREFYKKDVLVDPDSIPELVDFKSYLAHIQPVGRQQALLHLTQTLLELKPDVIHGWMDEEFINACLVSGMLGWKNLVGRWGAMPPGVNRVFDEKSLSNIDYLLSAYSEIKRLENPKFSCNSAVNAGLYCESINLEVDRVKVVYNGIDSGRLDHSVCTPGLLREELGVSTKNIVGTVIRLSEEKQPFLWLDVAKIIQETVRDVAFCVVGTGPLLSQLQEHVELIGLTNIHFLGEKDNVADWYRLFDVLLMTSRAEGVSNVVIESQYCGCPVVAPAVGGMTEAVRSSETGLLVDSDRAGLLAQAVCRLLQDRPLREMLSDQGMAFAADEFSNRRMVGDYIDIYNGTPCKKKSVVAT